jgi:hypothetical protein
MFFDNDILNSKDLDFSTKEGRAAGKAKLEEMLSSGSEKDKTAARILGKLFSLMDDIPEDYAVVHEAVQELKSIPKKLEKRRHQIRSVARSSGEHGQPVHRFGQVEAYIAVAEGALMAAATLLEKLEPYVSEQAIEREQARASAEEGLSGREAPTEPPPAPPS